MILRYNHNRVLLYRNYLGLLIYTIKNLIIIYTSFRLNATKCYQNYTSKSSIVII